MHRARALATDAYRSLADGQWSLTQAIARARARRGIPRRNRLAARSGLGRISATVEEEEEEGIPGRALNFCIKQDVRNALSRSSRCQGEFTAGDRKSREDAFIETELRAAGTYRSSKLA